MSITIKKASSEFTHTIVCICAVGCRTSQARSKKYMNDWFCRKGTSIELRKPGFTSLPCHRKWHGQVNDGQVGCFWLLWISVLWLLVSAGIAEHPIGLWGLAAGSAMADLWGAMANLCFFSVCFVYASILIGLGSCAWAVVLGEPLGRDEGRCPLAGHLTQTSGTPWAACFSSPSYTVLSSPTALGQGGFWEVLLVLHRSLWSPMAQAIEGGWGTAQQAVLRAPAVPLWSKSEVLLPEQVSSSCCETLGPGETCKSQGLLVVTSPGFLLQITAFRKGVWNGLLKSL